MGTLSEQADFRHLLDEIRGSVNQALSRVWEEELTARQADGTAVLEPLEAARDLCSRGGKRLRAALVAAAYCASKSQYSGSRVPLQPIVPVCTAVELLQSYFLIHDDWMDGDDMRRGGPAVHAQLRTRWTSEHLAASGGILAGDFTLALATRVLSTAPAVKTCLPEVLWQFSAMQLDVVSGQLLDVLDPNPNIERVYELKTGSYTVVGPLRLGGLLAGGDNPWFPEVEAYGLALGVAFQLQDDLIGMLASQDATGKPRGSDLKSGKHTLLCRTALRLASSEGQAQIRVVFGNVDATPGEVEQAIAVVESCGAEQIVRERINTLVQEATRLVDSSEQLTDYGKQLLREICHALTSRKI